MMHATNSQPQAQTVNADRWEVRSVDLRECCAVRRKPVNFKGTMAKLLQYLKQYPGAIDRRHPFCHCFHDFLDRRSKDPGQGNHQVV